MGSEMCIRDRRAETLPVAILTLRNIVLVVLLAVGIRALVRVPAHRSSTTRE